MSVHTKKPPTKVKKRKAASMRPKGALGVASQQNRRVVLTFIADGSAAEKLVRFSKGIAGVKKESVRLVDSESLTFEEAFPDYHPGDSLAGMRYREGLTQEQLAKKTGIPQRHISEMENDKRNVGIKRAKILAKALNTNYKVFL